MAACVASRCRRNAGDTSGLSVDEPMLSAKRLEDCLNRPTEISGGAFVDACCEEAAVDRGRCGEAVIDDKSESAMDLDDRFSMHIHTINASMREVTD